MIMIVKTPASQVVSPAVEERAKVRAGGGEDGEIGCATEVNDGVDVYRMHTEKSCAVQFELPGSHAAVSRQSCQAMAVRD